MAERLRAGALRVDAVVVGMWTAVVAAFTIVGADAMWAVAMGRAVWRTGDPLPSLPYAASASKGWAGPLALGELLLAGADRVPVGLAVLQVVVVAVTLAVTAAEVARWGGSPPAAGFAVSLTVLGGLTAFVIMRLPSLSLVPFAVLAALLRRQHDRPTRAVWWAPALLAGWANLHGGVLIGAALFGAFLVASRLRTRPVEAVLLGLAAAVALCATPALWRTPAYYVGVFVNEAARRGSDLWARPDPTHPLDLLLLLAAVVLLVLAVRRRPPLWELLALAGLAVGTAMAARNGVWLLLLAAPAVGPRHLEGHDDARTVGMRALAVVTVLAVVVGAGIVVARDPATRPPGDGQVAALRQVVGDRVVLASEPLAETLAARGLRVWAGNPIDAFPRATQVALLDFLGQGRVDPRVMPDVEVVVVPGGSDVVGDLTDHGWRRLPDVGPYAVLERAS